MLTRERSSLFPAAATAMGAEIVEERIPSLDEIFVARVGSSANTGLEN